MTFDFTHGNEAKYVMFIHRCSVNDVCYFDTLKGARNSFVNHKEMSNEKKGTSIVLYDMEKDSPIDHYRF